jgi:glycosyltransferase involved in cell wall biosynthesis
LNQKRQLKILYFVQLPPPVHGVSVINKLIYTSQIINLGIDTYLLEIRFSNRIDQLRRLNVRKIYQFIRLALRLISSIRSIRPDIIYFSIMPVGKGLLRDLFFVLIIKWFKVKPVYHLHNKGIERNSKIWIIRQLYQYIFRNSYVIHLSRNLYDNEMSMLKLVNTKYRIIHNGISLLKPVEPMKKLSVINLLYLSNLFPQKGIFNLIEIFKILESKYPDAILSIVGGFPYRKTHEQVLKLIKKYDLEKKILLKGPKYGKHKTQEYNQADIFVYPTSFRQECFPLVILEAMQSGLPIITTDEGAISEIIDNGINGIVIKNWTAESFAEELALLIRNSDLRSKLGENAKKKFREYYTINNLERNIRDFFEEEFLN